MSKDDTEATEGTDNTSDARRLRLGDIATALALLTRLPVSARFERGAAAAWAYPLVGAVIGLASALPTGAALALGLPPVLAALIWLAMHVILTGAMHEDGTADSADGLWGGWDAARRLEIMKDSHIGSYGVIALCLSLAARWAAIAIILQSATHWTNWLWPLVAIDILSRAAMPALMAALPHARNGGLSHATGRAAPRTAIIAALLATLLAALMTGTTALSLIATATLVTLLVGAIAKSKIGGQTGDILGAAQQLTEIALLFALAA